MNTRQPVHGNEVIQRAQQAQLGAARAFRDDLEAYAPQIEAALPDNISVRYYTRVLLTAVNEKPELLYADRRSLLNAAVKCASDGLLPDGREAFLNIYSTEIRMRDPVTMLDQRVRKDLVQYQAMVAGVRKRLRNSGDVLSAVAEAVFEKDRFAYRLGDNPMIEHEPAPFGTDRGKLIGAYAIIKLRNGEVIRDVMDWPAIEVSRNQNRYWNTSLMWTKFPAEGAKKTALLRASKQAPRSAQLESALRNLSEHDELPVYHEPEKLPPSSAPSEPLQTIADARHDEPEHQAAEPEYQLVSLDGEILVFADPHRAADALALMLPAAAKMGEQRLEGIWQDNQETVYELGAIIDTGPLTDLRASLRETTAPAYDPRQDDTPIPAGGDDAPAQTTPVAAPSPPRENYSIPMVKTRDGKSNHRAWAMGRFIPEMRKLTDSTELALLIGHNDEALEVAKQDAGLMRDIEGAIAAQWETVKQFEQRG